MVLLPTPDEIRERIESEKAPPPQTFSALDYTKAIASTLALDGNSIGNLIKDGRVGWLKATSDMSPQQLALTISTLVIFSAVGNAKPTKSGAISFAKSKGNTITESFRQKVERAVEEYNKQDRATQLDGIQKIRQASVDALVDLRRNTTRRADQVALDIEINEARTKLNESILEKQANDLNKLDRYIQFKVDKGVIVRDKPTELQNKVDDMNAEGGYMGKYKYKVENGEIVIDRPKADPEVIKENESITDRNIREAIRLTEEANRREQLAKEAREKAKAEDKEIDRQAELDDEKGTPDGGLDEVIETREKLDKSDEPNFGDDAEAKESEPLIEREKTDEEIIDEAIESNRQTNEASDIVKKAGGAGTIATTATQIAERVTRDDNEDKPMLEEEPPVIPTDLVAEFTDEPVEEGEPQTEPTKKDIALNASISSYVHNAKTKPYNIKRTITSKNIDELFLYVLDLCEDSYQKETRYEVDKYFIDGNFPVLFNKSGDTIFVIFRGTNRDFSTFQSSINSISNMLSDLATWDGTGLDQNIKNSTLVQQALLSEEDRDMGGHGGFIKELSTYYTKIAQEIQKYDGTCNHVVLGGHSAGGALATLFYYVYANDRNLKSKIKVEYLITYGSPRTIINKHEYITRFNNSCPSYYRVFNVDDIVSYVPFNKGSSFETKIASGFTHVGLPMCLDSNIDDNSLNALILQVIKGNVDKYSEIFLNYNLDQIRENKLIEFITSDKYLELMGQSMFKCYESVGTREDVPDEMLMYYARNLANESEKLSDYALKCDLLEPLTISDMIKANNIGENEAQENVTIASLGSVLLGYNKMSVEAHLFPMYRDNLNKRVDREVFDRTPFLESFKYESPLPKPVTAESVEIDLLESIQDDIDKGYIMGITTSQFEEGNLFIL